MRHLILAPLASAYGEALLGVRIARGLVAAGHEVVFLAPAALHAVVGDAPVQFGRIDLALASLDRQLAPLVRRMRCDSLVLIDAAAVGKTARALRLDPRAFTHPGVPVVALDCWNLPRDPVAWDYGTHAEVLPAEFHQLARRMIAVPVAPPGVANGFAAMPEVAPLGAAERAAVRAELGIGEADRMVVWPSARWQHAEHHDDPKLAGLAAALPMLVLPALDALGAHVHVVHVGPVAFPDGGARYHFVSQLAPRRFEPLIAAADLMIGCNAAATSLATAIAARTPVVLGGTGRHAELPATLPAAVRDRLVPILPFGPIHAWPLGLDAVLAPIRAGNPLWDAVRPADVLDPSFADACRALLFDCAAADELRAAQDAYHRRVAALPAGHELLLDLLGR